MGDTNNELPQSSTSNSKDVVTIINDTESKSSLDNLTCEKDSVKTEIKESSSNTDINNELLPSVGIIPEADSPNVSINTAFQVEESNKQNESDKSVDVNKSVSNASQSAVAGAGNSTPIAPYDVSHKIKKIKWKGNNVPIITQNNNGPCPLISLINALVLKGSIKIPSDSEELKGEQLVTIVANALFDLPKGTADDLGNLEANIRGAVNILPSLLTGLDVNIKFSGIRDFEFTDAISIFDLLNVSLYHGWVVDENLIASDIISNLSYNQLTNKLIAWKESNDDGDTAKAIACEDFIRNSVSQLTMTGLYDLGAKLKENEIAVLFRNNHFATIHKKHPTLYLLLTDQGYLQTNAVWETLTDIDSRCSEFVDGELQPIQQEEPQNPQHSELMTREQQINSDHQLAALLQQEDEKVKQREESSSKLIDELGCGNLTDEEIARRLQERENEEASRQEEEELAAAAEASAGAPCTQPPPHFEPRNSQESNKKKKECIII